jgi:aminoglycoside 6-adenylyltransferase
VSLPTRELEEIGQDFWYHAIWAAKKWRRGEAIVARSCLESHLKPLLLEADRLRATGDTWHGTRFAESWAAPEVVDAWWTATARSPDELQAALLRVCDTFASIAPHAAVRARLEELLP